MLLTQTEAEKHYTIAGNEYKGRIRARLDSLGLVEGEEVYVLANTFAGIILIIKGSRLAVCKSLARKVKVR